VALTSSSEQSQFSDTTQLAPGLNLRAAILNDLFGVEQRLADGTFQLGPAQEYIPLTEHEIRAEIKRKGGDPIGKQDPRRNTPEIQRRRDEQFAKIQEQFRQKHLRAQGQDVSGRFAQSIFGGGGGNRTGFSAIGDLLTQANPFQDNFLDITRQAARNQAGIFDSAGQALQGFLADGGRSDIDALVNRGLTDIKEQFSAQGQLFSTDLTDQVIRNRAEQEALGRNRLLAAIGLAGDFGNQQLNFGSGLLDVGQQFNAVGTPGGRAITLLDNLLGSQSADFFGRGANTTSGGFSESKGGIGEFLGGLGSLTSGSGIQGNVTL